MKPVLKLWLELVIYCLLFLVFIAFIFINSQNTSLTFLPFISIDEYTFFNKYITMYKGLKEGSLSTFFSYGFYNYGFWYFALNLVVTLPFIVIKKFSTVIFLARMTSAFFALASLFTVYRIFRLWTTLECSILGALIVLAMPGFWVNGFWNHPDWWMTFWLLLSVYTFMVEMKLGFAQKLNTLVTFSPRFWLGVFYFSLAVAFKLQAITFLPLVVLICLTPLMRYFKGKETSKTLLRLIKALALILVTFMLLNPFILHPVGLQAFIKTFNENMLSNATAHNLNISYTVFEKLSQSVVPYYFSWPVLLLLILALVYQVFRFFSIRQDSFFSILAFTCLLNLGYLLFFVNKTWQHYYLPVAMLMWVCFVWFLRKSSTGIQRIILVSILLIQFYFFGAYYKPLFANTKPVQSVTKTSAIISEQLKDLVSPNHHILVSSYIPFPFQSLPLDFAHVHVFFGPFNEALVSQVEHEKKWKSFKGYKPFNVPQFIILNKNDAHFDKTLEKQKLNPEQYQNGRRLIDTLKNGKYDYKVIFENESLLILGKK